VEEDEDDDEEEEEEDNTNAVIVDEDMIYEGNNRNTFRPVSILESGLDLNENELNYDLNRNFGGTMHNGTFYDGDRDQFQSFAGQRGGGDMHMNGSSPRQSIMMS
jgi:hypothetical protein